MRRSSRVQEKAINAKKRKTAGATGGEAEDKVDSKGKEAPRPVKALPRSSRAKGRRRTTGTVEVSAAKKEAVEPAAGLAEAVEGRPTKRLVSSPICDLE
jgi:hypothetical protein